MSNPDILLPGDEKMKSNEDMLSSILKTTQMGQIGIRSVLKAPTMSGGMKRALHSQLKEYDAIETETHAIAAQRGLELAELDPAVKAMSDMMTRMKLSYGCNDSKIAAMMVQGNTRGVIKGLKNIHRYDKNDRQITDLSRKLLDCENSNILQMEGFL